MYASWASLLKLAIKSILRMLWWRFKWSGVTIHNLLISFITSLTYRPLFDLHWKTWFKAHLVSLAGSQRQVSSLLQDCLRRGSSNALFPELLGDLSQKCPWKTPCRCCVCFCLHWTSISVPGNSVEQLKAVLDTSVFFSEDIRQRLQS